MESEAAPSPFVSVFANLRMILHGLLAAMGAWRLEPVMAIVLYRRVSRTMGRIERMMARFQAGRMWRVMQRDAAPGQRGRVVGCGPALPRRFGWLVQKGGQHAACFASQLQAVLNTPEMTELLTGYAQAQRVLRPLCRALAVDLPGACGTACPEPRARKPRTRNPRAQPEPFQIPLPRGTQSWARRQGFGKMC